MLQHSSNGKRDRKLMWNKMLKMILFEKSQRQENVRKSFNKNRNENSL